MDWREYVPLPVLLPLHLVSTGAWLGAILATSSLAARARLMADGPEIGRLATSLHRRFAWPALVLAFATGVLMVAEAPAEYVTARWFYVELALTAAMIVAHVAVGRRAKRVSSGARAPRVSGAVVALAAIASVTAALTIGVLKGGMLP
jgi:uncharacterized membrane protein